MQDDPPHGAEPVPPEAAALLDAAALATALGVPIQTEGGTVGPPVYRFSQRVAFAEGLSRHGVLDLSALTFRSTLWAGPHRCLDHLELAGLADVACDPQVGRLVLSTSTIRVVVSRHGTVSVVPLGAATARGKRRGQQSSGA